MNKRQDPLMSLFAVIVLGGAVLWGIIQAYVLGPTRTTAPKKA